MTHPTWQEQAGCAWGSLEIVGPRYRAVQVRGPVFSPTYYRQLRANQLGAICYVEAHYNSSPHPKANYGECILAPDRAATRLATAFLKRLEAATKIPCVGSRVGKGSGNVARVRCPAMLVEPGFVSNPEWAAYVRKGEGADCIARCLAEAIRECFPEGGLVALSVGHAYRGARGDDWSQEETLGDGGAHVAKPEAWQEEPAYNEEAELGELMVMACGEFLAGYK